MSRRSRRGRRKTGGGGWLAKAALSLIVLGLLAAGVLYATVRGYLHSDAFRRLLSGKVSAAAGVSGEFTPFRWDGLAVDTAAFEADGEGMIRKLRLDGLHTEVGVGGLRRGVWELRDARVRRLDVTVDARKREARLVPPLVKESPSLVKPSPPPGSRNANTPGWIPREVALQALDLRQVSLNAVLDQGMMTASGMRVAVESAGGKRAYRIEITDGGIQLPFRKLPLLRLDHARLRYQDGSVFLTSAAASAWSEGRIDATGEWDGGLRRFFIEGNVSGLKCEELLSENWAKRVIGELGSDFSINNHAGETAARGRVTLRNGTLTALPVLDALAAYADTRRFRMLALSEAHAVWSWRKNLIDLNEIVLASEGLARLEGRLSIRGRELDGLFRLGLAPGSLARIPGAETHVFSPGAMGMMWTPLRITGTFDDPKEDLTDRLILAAGLRMLETLPETGEKVLKFTHSVLGGDSSKTLGKGVKIIEEGSKTVREVSGILDGILGGGRQREVEPAPESEDGQP
ncbi:MAG: hypothetical protein Q8Q59_08520 [Luteolibacter sp.]|jgi:hypothetical protein|nr:hypothetical protein [Luteolibacter sp.]